MEPRQPCWADSVRHLPPIASTGPGSGPARVRFSARGAAGFLRADRAKSAHHLRHPIADGGNQALPPTPPPSSSNTPAPAGRSPSTPGSPRNWCTCSKARSSVRPRPMRLLPGPPRSSPASLGYLSAPPAPPPGTPPLAPPPASNTTWARHDIASRGRWQSARRLNTTPPVGADGNLPATSTNTTSRAKGNLPATSRVPCPL